MAHPSVVINGVTYQNCPEVDIPQSGSGTAKFYDASEADAEAGNVLTGKVFIGPNGQDTGSMPNNGPTGGDISTKTGTVTIPAGYTSGGTVFISYDEQQKLVQKNIKNGVSILGVRGSLTTPTISQDSSGILSIS